MLLENLISEFNDKYNSTEIKKLAFHLPHVCILGTHYCVKECHAAFKCRRKQYDVLCRCDYSECIVSSFSYQIQSEYYGGNRYVSIEGIALEHFSASNQASSSLTSDTLSLQEVFH